MRKLLSKICEIMLSGILAIGISTAHASTEKDQAGDAYPWLRYGLVKFNHRLPSSTHILVTLVGWSRSSCAESGQVFFRDRAFFAEKSCEIVGLKFITRDGDYLEKFVMLRDVEMSNFIHELSPSFGRYVSWNPVIQVYVSAERSGFIPEFKDEIPLGALQLVGRFWVQQERDRKTGELIMRDYHEERYRY